jgi:hypothetical protein
MDRERSFEEVILQKSHFVLCHKKMVRKYRRDVLMQEDEAKYHSAKGLNLLILHKLRRLLWPVHSPDLSPIENMR